MLFRHTIKCRKLYNSFLKIFLQFIMNEDLDILGFDPSQLSVFAKNDENSSNTNHNLYTPRPAESKSEDGVYRAKIKVIYSPQNLKNSVVEEQSYFMQDENGYFSAQSSLMIDDKSCPIFSAWKKCRYSDVGTPLWKQQAKAEDGGKQLFDKRFARYVTIQVLEDKNKPELEGRYMIWKLPKSIWDMIEKKQHPSPESGNFPIPVMDFLFGYAIKLEVNPGPDDPRNPQRKTREISYSGEFTKHPVSCLNPDKSPLLTSSEQRVLDKYIDAIEDVWDEEDVNKRNNMLSEINADPNTAELRRIYKGVLENLKELCPDVNKEFGFKPWDENLARRVQKWIDIVLSGNEPKTNTPNTITEDKNSTSSTATVEEDDTPVSVTNSDDEDLPF